jgi:hypothetical protein
VRLRPLKALVPLVLGALAIGDIVCRSRVMLYSADEVINLDAILSFLTKGDYTSGRFGGVPFDPAISSGIIATWTHGAVFLLGGDLFAARLVAVLLHFAVASAIMIIFLRSRDCAPYACVLVALSLWICASLLPVHRSLEIVTTGEMWGFLFLVVGTFFARGAPLWAAFVWGLAVWVCKVVYLPFAIALLVASVHSTEREKGIGLRSIEFLRLCSRNVLAFALPLVAWMGIIWLRYDLGTVAHWAACDLAFVTKHVTGITISAVTFPGIRGCTVPANWGNVAPFVYYSPSVVIPTLIAVAVGPLIVLGRIYLARRDAVALSTREMRFTAAGAVAVVLFAAWFVAMDPTQWGRHLLPAVYASLGLTFYCVADIWQALPGRARVLQYGVGGAFVVTVGCCAWEIVDYFELMHWRMSYAKTCARGNVLNPPCQQDAAVAMMWDPGSALYVPPGCDPQCFQDVKRRAVAQAEALLKDERGSTDEITTVGYALISLEHNRLYSDDTRFIEDFAPIICSESAGFRRYLETAGLDAAQVSRQCDRSPPTEPFGTNGQVDRLAPGMLAQASEGLPGRK